MDGWIDGWREGGGGKGGSKEGREGVRGRRKWRREGGGKKRGWEECVCVGGGHFETRLPFDYSFCDLLSFFSFTPSLPPSFPLSSLQRTSFSDTTKFFVLSTL